MIKLNLECGESPRNGYLNITSRPLSGLFEDGIDIAMGRFDNLDPIVKDESCEEIVFGRFLNVMSPENIIKTLEHWFKKLSSGGRLKICYIDIRRLSLFAFRGDMGLGQLHNHIYGDSYNYRSILDLKNVQNALKSLNYSIDVVSPESFAVSLECIKK